MGSNTSSLLIASSFIKEEKKDGNKFKIFADYVVRTRKSNIIPIPNVSFPLPSGNPAYRVVMSAFSD